MTKKDDETKRDLDEDESDDERDESDEDETDEDESDEDETDESDDEDEDEDDESDDEDEDDDESDEDADDEDDEDEDEDEDDDDDDDDEVEAAPAKTAASTSAADEDDEDDEDEDEDDDEEEDDEEEDDDEEGADDEDEDEDDDEDEDEEDEEEDEAPAASAHPTTREDQKAERARRRRELLEHSHGVTRDELDDGEDPQWWIPHAVLGTLVLIGVLGFFGVFNRALGFLAAKPEGQAAATTETAKPATTPATPPPRPDQAGQAPRETFGAKHLLVMYKGSRRAPPTIERSKEEAKARAEEAHKKAKAGTKFEDLVKDYSDEPGAAQRGGDLGNFPKGAMVPEFQAGLEKTKVGEISDIVETPFGYHVILRTK